MLRFRSCVLTHLISSSAAFPISSLHRLLSTAVPAPPIPASAAFTGEDYLVATCGLTRAQALKAWTQISHLKSPSKPDAVIAYLAGLGLSRSDIAAVVAKDPKFLCTSVEKTLDPIVIGLTGLGMSRSEIARLVSFARVNFRSATVVSRLQYYLQFFGSFENLLLMLRRSAYFLSSDLERVVKPTVQLLMDCGLSTRDIGQLCMRVPWLLTTNIERAREMVAYAEGVGVPRGSRMFRHALQAVAFQSKEKIAAKVEYLKKTFGWSDSEVGIVVSKLPTVLMASKERLQSKSQFLISEVGLEPAYIAHRPAMISYSLEGRLRPRYYVVKLLKENGLLDCDRSYYSAVNVTEKVFMEKYIFPHSEAAQHLAEDYAAACSGGVMASFRLT